MSLLFLPTPHFFAPSNSTLSSPFRCRLAGVCASAAAPPSTKRKPKRKKKQQQGSGNVSSSSFRGYTITTATERSLRFAFMEELMDRARNRDVDGVSDVIYDMIAAGLKPGPRSFHGLVVANVLKGDHEGAMQSLRRELSTGQRPLHETFVALIRVFGSKGLVTKGLEILAAMESLKYDIRKAWIILVEELIKHNYMEDANSVFLKGAKGGLRATDELYDLIIQEDCKAGDHSNALDIAYEMEAAGRMATTFHFNCLLSVQATCGIPEIAMTTFENMEYGGEAFMKPDTETYNWVIQAYTRAESYDRVQNVAELLGMMVEDHKRLQPNVRTYALLVECFTKYSVIREAIRHFRALKNFNGGTKLLHCEGNFGDPLSLYLRALCREGMIVELLEALETMIKDDQPIPPRAMILNRKYRTLVSSWIEPLHEEAQLGYQVDYVARYIEEGGLTGERKRWVPRRGEALDPDTEGFVYSGPIETSFKQRRLEEWKLYHRKLLKMLRNEGIAVLGDASESDYLRVEQRLMGIIKGPNRNVPKPKAASKMLVGEMREELEAQGLPTDGTRNVLYQRVQKARRINRSRGRPLWVPPVEEKGEELVNEELDELISRIKLQDGNTEFWRRRFLAEGVNTDEAKTIDVDGSEAVEVSDEVDVADDVSGEDTEDEGEEVEVEVEETKNQNADTVVKQKEVDDAKHPLQMMGIQLLMDSIEENLPSKKLKKRVFYEDDSDEDWFPLNPFAAFKELRERKFFDVDDMYTIADVWGWTWEREIRNAPPRRWSPEWEVELAVKLMEKANASTRQISFPIQTLKLFPLKSTELNHVSGDTTGRKTDDRRLCDDPSSSNNSSRPSGFTADLTDHTQTGLRIWQVRFLLDPLYDEVIALCIELGEIDAAIAITADMATSGINVADETLDRVIAARQQQEADDADKKNAGKNT
ncbi:Pentatricopeptide repeat-containing protein At1g12620 [Linum perenne]